MLYLLSVNNDKTTCMLCKLVYLLLSIFYQLIGYLFSYLTNNLSFSFVRILLILSAPLRLYFVIHYCLQQDVRQCIEFLCYANYALSNFFATAPSTNNTNKQIQRAVDCVENMKLKQRFSFQLGAFNQTNRIQYAFYIHFHIRSYVLVVVQ